MNVLLTSCGLETPAITDCFLRMLPKPPEEARAIFIPTAANSPDAIQVLPKCLNDLLKCGIRQENILVYDLHRPMSEAACCGYDVIYLCGGSPSHLMQRVNEAGFDRTMHAFIRRGGVVLGVSAGSMIFADGMPDNLGYLACPLAVHSSGEDREPPGRYPRQRRERIRLGNRQGLYWDQDSLVVFE
ncbi:MAG: Type 1 glutamine amidotransferase-like domain-containing protein [Aristaeellaceae bacterium]